MPAAMSRLMPPSIGTQGGGQQPGPVGLACANKSEDSNGNVKRPITNANLIVFFTFSNIDVRI